MSTLDYSMSARRTRRKHLPLIIGILLLLACGYVIGFFIIFDLSVPAQAWGDEMFGNKYVAVGPKPRSIFLRPLYSNIGYETYQWPFVAYRPFCEIWLRRHNFARPSAWK